jgi:probable F420-dependent oxidoreductase
LDNDPSRHWSVITPFMPAEMINEQVRRLEAAGLRGIYAPQIYGPPWIPLASAAGATDRMLLGSGIALAFARSPFETAMAAMDLDRISGGRFILGLGPSVRSWSEGFFGMPYGRPLEHLREVIGHIREIVAYSHTGQLDRLEGKYHTHDFTGFQPLAQPVRTEIPIYLAATRLALVRLAGELAQGLMGHPIWSINWATKTAAPALDQALQAAGRSRDDIEFNLWFWAAISDDLDEAVNDARSTVAFYAGIDQYEEYFAAHGYRAEARLCQEALESGNLAAGASSVPDEMARTFVLCGRPDGVRRALEPAWEVADTLCLMAPLGVETEKAIGYASAIAETFYS